ncbi:MAG: hypothetical protein U1D55_11905 [Phycisphaerae bacterium]
MTISPALGRWFGQVAPIALILLAIAVIHGPSLTFDLFLDDYAHFQQLRECDWSLRGLTDACRLELVGGVLQTPWLPDCTLRFFRPVAFGLMKLAYSLSGWSPAALHGLSLLWHAANCLTTALLMRRLGIAVAPAYAAAALFAIHPGHIGTVQWIAAQSELMVTAFLLAATLCFVRIRGSGQSRARKEAGDAETPEFVQHRGTGDSAELRSNPSPDRQGGVGSGGEIPSASRPNLEHSTPPLRSGLGSERRSATSWRTIGVLVLFALALGCRENAIVLPFVLICGGISALLRVRGHSKIEPVDAASSWRGAASSWRRRAAILAAMVVISVAYVAVRTWMLGPAGVPQSPYVRSPGEPGFWRFVSDKALYYLLGEFLLFPILPFAGVSYLQARPLVLYGLGGGIVLVIAMLLIANRRRCVAWLAVAWLILTMTPVLPAFESPHHLYLPGVGWTMLVAMALEVIRGAPNAVPRPPLRGIAFAGVVLAAAAVFGLVSFQFSRSFDTARGVEDRVIAEVADAAGGLRNGDTIYMLNLPLIAHYLGPALEQKTGLHDLRVVALTWSPRVLGMTALSEITWRDDRTIELEIAADRYFAGALGELVRSASGAQPGAAVVEGGAAQPAPALSQGENPLAPGRTRRYHGGTAEVLASDLGGVRALRFRFDAPLGVGRQRVFFGSQARWACEITPPRMPRE